jgi:hypothetical protein
MKRVKFVGLDVHAETIAVAVALYRRRAFREKVCTSTVLRRSFDKAVRRKPPVVAADAGPMQIQLWEGTVSRCPEARGRARQRTPEDEKGNEES